MRIKLEVWRQDGPRTWDFFESHVVGDTEPQISLLGLLDHLNDQIVEDGGEPVVFELDCREGVCGARGFLVNGVPHGSLGTTLAYHQHLRAFPGVTRFRLEPWGSATFLVIRNLVVDRTALNELIRAGGTVDVAAGITPDADNVTRGHLQTERALDFATRISYGTCMAAYPSGAAVLLVRAKLAHLSLMSWGHIEWGHRARAATRELDALFGPCSEFGECLPACPAGIPIEAIALLDREMSCAGLRGATHDDQGPLRRQGRVREFAP